MAHPDNRPTLEEVRREIKRYTERFRFESPGKQITPQHYVLALDKAARGHWSVVYRRRWDIDLDDLPLYMLVAIFTLGLALLLAAVEPPNMFATEATLTVHVADATLNRAGYAKGDSAENRDQALSQAVKTLVPAAP